MNFRRGENPLVAEIEEKIAEYTNTPVVNGEDMQVLMYRTGQHYKTHWDYFDPRFPQNQQVLQRGGQRIMTFMVFLNEVDNGGETHFPRVPNEDKTDSLKIKPKTGRAIIWWNVNEQGNIDTDTLHEGLDPQNGSIKFIITRWIREGVFI